MPAVRDHKRANVGDSGPNTGGMGSYSCENHSLPFLSPDELQQASKINKLVAEALRKETGEPYKGVLYGGFMATTAGIRLIEYNARFGDPEALNVLSLLTTDFADVCLAIIRGTLAELPIRFENLATVCKYVVPDGYPEHPVKGDVIDWSSVQTHERLKVFEAAVDHGEGGVYRLSGSRAVAFVGIGADVAEAERIAENAANAVTGPVYHRKDIGTAELIAKRVRNTRTPSSYEIDNEHSQDDGSPARNLKLVP
jgi:phosphoribosylamine--glycine ligase